MHGMFLLVGFLLMRKMFELLTGDYLFDPKSGSKYTKDDDHVAQITELFGHFPKNIANSGKFSNEIFNRRGELRNIQKLRFWKLEDVLVDKYHFERTAARSIAEFLLPCLEINQKKRASAATLLKSAWLEGVAE